MVKEYINSHWDECIRNNMEDKEDLIGLPYPYTVPAVGHFNEMYYWDTYFTNKGLECSKRFELAKNNVDNMLYLVNKYGFMPNGNRLHYLSRSQPPFLSMMVRDVYEHYKDKVWLNGAFFALCDEYDFWMKKRISPIGLNVYGGDVKEDEYEKTAEDYKKRVGFTSETDPEKVSSHYVLSCESGWDFNPRWDFEGFNYVPVDLNSLMYAFEKNMEYFSEELGNGQSLIWAERADKRKKLMCEYMDDGSGVLLDYNFKKCEHSKVLSAASFYPLYVNLVNEKQAHALSLRLSEIEAPHGIYTCVKNDVEGSYQWDYPNGWACLQYIVFIGLNNYGFEKDAVRIAKKYINLVEKVFEETDNIWEKYNVLEGNIAVNNEYKMPPMMGWSAGVYLAAENFVKKKDL